MVITSTTTHHHPPSSSSMAPPLDDDDDDRHHYPTTTANINPHSLKRRRTTNTINNNNPNSNSSSSAINSFFNFSSLPCFNVKWGHQKHLRCIKHSSHLPSSSRSTDFPTTNSPSLEAVSDKLIFDFRAQLHQMQSHFFNPNKSSPSPSHDVIIAEPQRPWNLRTRRAVCKDPYSNTNTNAVNGASVTAALRKPTFSPPTNLTEVNGNGNGVKRGNCDSQTKKRRQFSGCLSKHEIEEDFLAMLGSRPPRRPKKRPKLVQRLVDGVTPGLWLSEITADMYKVNEQPDTGKR